MVIFITGATHTGKTLLAQQLMELYNIPYISSDHIKMGLIRSGICPLTAMSSDSEMTGYLWPVICEIAKTNVENCQNIIIEGCYMPINWYDSFGKEYLDKVSVLCIYFTPQYIKTHFKDIMNHSDDIEKRLRLENEQNQFTEELLIEENSKYFDFSSSLSTAFIKIENEYFIPMDKISQIFMKK